MLSSRKIQFVIMLITAFIFMPLFAAEPNEPNEPNKPATELKFEMSNTPARWLIQNQQGKGPINPEYMAEFYIKESGNIPNQNQYGKFENPLSTNIGKSMSPGQKEFLDTSSSFELWNEPSPDKPIGYVRIHLYAVSRNDAEKMAKSFIEQINENAKKNKENIEEYLHKIEQTLSKDKKDLAEKEPKLKEAEDAFEKIKEKTHQFSPEAEAVDFAKKSIIEMDKTFNDFDIELAGIQERIKSIENYRNAPGQRPEIQAKLDSMYIDLMIELNGLEARKKVAKEIYTREQDFLSLSNKKFELDKEVEVLSKNIIASQDNLERLTYRLNLPSPDFIPADVYKNTVTIYPVQEENREFRYR